MEIKIYFALNPCASFFLQLDQSNNHGTIMKPTLSLEASILRQRQRVESPQSLMGIKSASYSHLEQPASRGRCPHANSFQEPQFEVGFQVGAKVDRLLLNSPTKLLSQYLRHIHTEKVSKIFKVLLNQAIFFYPRTHHHSESRLWGSLIPRSRIKFLSQSCDPDGLYQPIPIPIINLASFLP